MRTKFRENNLVSAADAQAALKELFKETLQEMLEAELETDLGYSKSEKAGYVKGPDPIHLYYTLDDLYGLTVSK